MRNRNSLSPGYPTPLVAAERGYIDDVIIPHATRRRVARGLAMLDGKVLADP